MTRRIKIVYYYLKDDDYGDYNDRSIQYLEDPTTKWEEVSDEDYNYLLSNIDRIKSPNGHSALILIERHPTQSIEMSIQDIKDELQKDIERDKQLKRDLAAKKAKEEATRKNKELERKKKQLERLKKELQDK